MASRMTVGSKPMRLVVGSGGIRFSPRASSRNRCIGARLRGGKFPGVGRASRGNAKGSAFRSAVNACPAGS